MKTTRLLTLPLLLLIPVVQTATGQTKTGTTIGQFLLIEPSARIAAMGNAGSTIYEDVQSAYYNPAAIGMLKTSGAQFTYSPWLADISYQYAALGITLGDVGNLYASVTALNSGEIDVRTVEQPLGTGERYTVSDISVGLGYGRQISEKFSVGLQVSYLQETIWHSAMSAFSFSIGTIYRISEDGLRLGASIANFGTRGTYNGRDLRVYYDQNQNAFGDNSTIPAELITESYPLPILFRVGLGLPFAFGDDHRLTLAVDAFHPSDNAESISVGAEWAAFNILSLRAGYQHLFLDDSEVGLTLGAGLQYRSRDFGVFFDYGWADYGLLQQAQRLTLGVTF